MAKILLVDYDQAFADAFESALRCDGHELFFVSGGREAAGLCRSMTPDLLFIDAELPSGMSLLRYLKNRKETKQISVVMITPAESIKLKKQALLWGADDYLDKPLLGELLQARVASTLLRREREKELGEVKTSFVTPGGICALRHEINNPLAGIIANVQVLRLLNKDIAMEKRLAEMEDLGFRISSILEKLGKPAAIRSTDYVDLGELAVAG